MVETMREVKGEGAILVTPRMLTLEEAGAALRMAPRTLREPHWLSRLGARKIGRNWLVNADTITKYLTIPQED